VHSEEICDSCVAGDFVFDLFHFVMFLSNPFGCDPVSSESFGVSGVYICLCQYLCVEQHADDSLNMSILCGDCCVDEDCITDHCIYGA
jgi:hypothetical protein